MIQSPLCDTLLLRQGMLEQQQMSMSITDFEAIKVFVLAEKVEMIVWGLKIL
jgi:phosphoribosylamine--glycine ligase